jgi:hypothetical protein
MQIWTKKSAPRDLEQTPNIKFQDNPFPVLFVGLKHLTERPGTSYQLAFILNSFWKTKHTYHIIDTDRKRFKLTVCI